jgi:DNA replication protein DnaC
MTKCNICNGFGFILRTDKYGEDVWSPCECRKQQDGDRAWDYKLTAANIPKLFRNYTFENYLALPFSAEVRRFNAPQVEKLKTIKEDPQSFFDKYKTLWIWGKDVNSGHTTLAIILGMRLIELGSKVRFIRIQTLLDAFVKAFKDPLQTAYLEELKNFDVYIIDDAFDLSSSTVGGQYTQTHLFQFIDEAISQDKHFIMTSNINVADIPEDFSRSRTVLSRSIYCLELRGTISPIEI